MDKRVKMVFAGLCLCVMLIGCAEDRDTQPLPDMQQILDGQGIEDVKFTNGSSKDSTRND